MDDTTLLVDQRSASLAASEVDVRVWASGRRVFVSSLITDMPGERSAPSLPVLCETPRASGFGA